MIPEPEQATPEQIDAVIREAEEMQKDALRLRWLAETMQDAQDSDARGSLCNFNGSLLMVVLERFHKWRKLPPNDALDAMRKAVDTQVVHELHEENS